jgi:hypothetical protein
MSYRSDVDSLAAREAALTLEVENKIRERDAASSLLAEMRARQRLPILDNIRVATPCSADWDQMTGDERARLCGQCNRDVYNISGLTRDEAEELIIEKEGELCVRYFQRADGTILLADCEVGRRQTRRHRLLAAGAVAALASSGVLGYELARSVVLERVEVPAAAAPAAVSEPVLLPEPLPPPGPAVELEPRAMGGVPPEPTAEQRLHYKQLKQRKQLEQLGHLKSNVRRR